MSARSSVLLCIALLCGAPHPACSKGLGPAKDIDDFVDLRLKVMAEGGSPADFNPPPIVDRPGGDSGRLTGIVSYIDQTALGLDPFEQPLNGAACGTEAGDIFLVSRLRIRGTTGEGVPVFKVGRLRPTEREDIAWVLDSGFELGVLEIDYYPSSLSAISIPGVKEPVIHGAGNCRTLEGGGGSSIELHEIFPDGTRILLGDATNGGSPVYIPEPATLLLLALGGLAVLARRP